MIIRVIRCFKCGARIEGNKIFDELANENCWIKIGNKFICPDCQDKPKRKKGTFPKFGDD